MNPLRWIRERFSATSRMIAAARESIRPTKLKAPTPRTEPLPAPPKALGHSGFLKWKKTLDKPEENDREQ